MRVQTLPAGARKRHGWGFGAALLAAALVCLIVAGLSSVFFFVSVRNNASASFIRAQPGAVPWNERRPLTIALMGQDGTQVGNGALSTLSIARYDPSGASASLLAIPTNLWVRLPGYGPSTLRDAYTSGGVRMVLLVTQSLLHVPIPYYAVIPSRTVRAVTAALGGVDLRVRNPQTVSVTGTGPTRSVRLHAGVQQVDANTLLSYAGSEPSSPNGAIILMRHWQTALAAVLHRTLDTQHFFQIPNLVNENGGSVITNFPYDQLPDLAHSLLSLSGSHVRHALLRPGNHTVTYYQSSGGNVFLPDTESIAGMAQKLFADPALARPNTVDVWNGVGTPGSATQLARWLRQAGIQVHQATSAPSYTYAHTQVVVIPDASAGVSYIAQSVANLLQVPLTVRQVPGRHAPVLAILGQDYQDPSQN